MSIRSLITLAALAPLFFSSISVGQTYDFTNARAQIQNNLALYGNRVIALIEQGDRGEIFRYQAGAITANTKVAIGSSSKWLSGAVVLQCAERGYFSLDDRIGQYLPIFDTYGKGQITIRQCFAMTSGLQLNSPEYETDSTWTLAQSVDLIAQFTPLAFTAGTQLSYESDGMQVVGRICEVVTGKAWGTLARELLFDPLGMTTADYLLFAPNPSIPGGVRCSAEDYLKFLRMLMNNGVSTSGTPVLSSWAVQEFFTNQSRNLPEYFSPWPTFAYPYSQRPDYGMGSWILAQNTASLMVEEVGSPGAFGAFPWVDRKRNLRGIIMMLDTSGNTFLNTVVNNLRVLAQVRAEIDAIGLPPAPPTSPLTFMRSGDFMLLNWQGGTLQTSGDLQTWTSHNWADAPFAEYLKPTRYPRQFYRILNP
jgi:CubicO group peptidase (beta-lactamase class C family)